MSKKRAADISIALVFTALFLITAYYREQVRESLAVLWGTAIAAVFFFALAVKDREMPKQSAGKGRMKLPADTPVITEAVLLSEEDTELMAWDMYGKISLVIGRDRKDNETDIDLRESPFASMVEREHAVLNYSGGNWFVEDLGSANGLSIQRDDRKIYQLAPDALCRIERGDCLYVGRNRLLFR